MSNTINTIYKEIEFLEDISSLACEYPHLVKRGGSDYFGNPINELMLTDEAQARLDELKHYESLYEDGISYSELCGLYNLGSESLLPTFQGVFSTGNPALDTFINNL